MTDDPAWIASDLLSLVRSKEEGGSPLETLWEQCPGIWDKLTIPSDVQDQAARAYLYAAGDWIEKAKQVFPRLAGAPDSADLYREMGERIATLGSRVALLRQMGYSATLDGVSETLAALARKVSEWIPGKGTLAVGGVAVVVIAVLVLVLVLR